MVLWLCVCAMCFYLNLPKFALYSITCKYTELALSSIPHYKEEEKRGEVL